LVHIGPVEKVDMSAATLNWSAGLGEVAVSALRKDLANLLQRVGLQRERVLLTNHGKPVAALVPLTDVESLAELDAAARGRMAERAESADAASYEAEPLEDVIADIGLPMPGTISPAEAAMPHNYDLFQLEEDMSGLEVEFFGHKAKPVQLFPWETPFTPFPSGGGIPMSPTGYAEMPSFAGMRQTAAQQAARQQDLIRRFIMLGSQLAAANTPQAPMSFQDVGAAATRDAVKESLHQAIDAAFSAKSSR
jgi:prevent-host-death family protein